MVDHPALTLASLDAFLPNPSTVSAPLPSESTFLFKLSTPDIELLSLEWKVTLGLSVVE